MEQGQQFNDFLAQHGFTPEEQERAENNELAIDLNHADFHDAHRRMEQKSREALGLNDSDIEPDANAWMEANRLSKAIERHVDKHKSLTGQNLIHWTEDDDIACSHCGNSLMPGRE